VLFRALFCAISGARLDDRGLQLLRAVQRELREGLALCELRTMADLQLIFTA
jgi:hypothetical protein